MPSDQCEHSGRHGQCHNPRVDGSVYCDRHSDEADRIRGYRLIGPLKERFEHHTTSAQLGQLRQEVAILRALIEDRLTMGDTPAERMAAAQFVRPAIVDIVKCEETLAKLERQANIVVGKEALVGLSKAIIAILVEELEDVQGYTSIVDRVAKRIASAIADTRNHD